MEFNELRDRLPGVIPVQEESECRISGQRGDSGVNMGGAEERDRMALLSDSEHPVFRGVHPSIGPSFQ